MHPQWAGAPTDTPRPAEAVWRDRPRTCFTEQGSEPGQCRQVHGGEERTACGAGVGGPPRGVEEGRGVDVTVQSFEGSACWQELRKGEMVQVLPCPPQLSFPRGGQRPPGREESALAWTPWGPGPGVGGWAAWDLILPPLHPPAQPLPGLGPPRPRRVATPAGPPGPMLTPGSCILGGLCPGPPQPPTHPWVPASAQTPAWCWGAGPTLGL